MSSKDVETGHQLMALADLLTHFPLKYAVAQNPPPTQGFFEGWSNLAGEVKENILKWLGRRDLRSCRLVDRETGSTATRVLFRTVCLSPSMSSVDRLIMISLEPTLAKLVRKIEIHTAYLIDAPFEQFLTFGPLAQRLQRLHPLEAAAETLRLFHAYKAELKSQEKFSSQGPQTLKPILKRFTQLLHFVHVRPSARNEAGSYVLDGTSALVERTGVCLLHGENQYPLMNSVLQKVEMFRPVSIDFSSLYWWEFQNIGYIPHLPDLLSKVTTFKITFQVESFDRPLNRLNAKSRYWVRGVPNHLLRLPSYLPRVEDLTLGFDCLPSTTESNDAVRAYALTRMTGLFLQPANSGPSYPKLKNLSLENIATTVEDLEAFLLPHVSTLKSLTLRNMHIDGKHKESDDEGILDSMLAIAGLLWSHFELGSMSYRGRFEDHVGESLQCDGTGGIMHDIGEFICHRC